MQVKATELRKGMVLQKDGALLLITDYSHATPGNWRAVIHVKTKNLETGQTGAFRPASGDVFETAYLDRKKVQYLYQEGNGDYVFMDQETYDQFHISTELGAGKMEFVKESDEVEVTFHGANPIGIELPATVVLEVTEAEMAVKGNTASNVKKDAVVETGLKVRVPMHITVGERIKISTDSGEFQGRAN